MLAIQANSPDVTAADMEETIMWVQAMKSGGREAGKLRLLTRRRASELDATLFEDGVTQGEPVEAESTIGLAKRWRERVRNNKGSIGGLVYIWEDLLDIIEDLERVTAQTLLDLRLRDH